MVDMGHYTFVKTHSLYNTVNTKLWASANKNKLVLAKLSQI